MGGQTTRGPRKVPKSQRELGGLGEARRTGGLGRGSGCMKRGCGSGEEGLRGQVGGWGARVGRASPRKA